MLNGCSSPAGPAILVTGIPRLFHWIWLGSSPIPPQQRLWIDGWLRHHPGWDYHLWTDANLPPLRNASSYAACTTAAQKADILRYEVVNQRGGVYLDTDVECIRNIETLVATCDAFVGQERPDERGPHYGNAIIGARPGHPAIDTVIDALPRSFAENSNRTISEQTGPDFLTRVLVGRSDMKFFPYRYFYPLDWYEIGTRPRAVEDVYAIHHYTLSWLGEDERRLMESVARLSSIIDDLPQQGDAVVSGGWLTPVLRTRRRLVRLPSSGGNPSDCRELVSGLECARASGAVLLALLQPVFWWYETYPEFLDHVRSVSRPVFEDDVARVFALSSA